jgi:hypothetical protein
MLTGSFARNKYEQGLHSDWPERWSASPGCNGCT